MFKQSITHYQRVHAKAANNAGKEINPTLIGFSFLFDALPRFRDLDFFVSFISIEMRIYCPSFHKVHQLDFIISESNDLC